MFKYCPNCGEKIDDWFADGSGWGSVIQCDKCETCYINISGDWGTPDEEHTITYDVFRKKLLQAPQSCLVVSKTPIAFYFGTFNPIHNGHLYVAKQLEELGYFTLFVPAYASPWKEDTVNNFAHRATMIYSQTFKLSLIEKELGTPSFSAQTVRNLMSEYGLDKINYVIGMDAFAQINKWANPEELRKYCHFLVIPRESSSVDFRQMEQDGWDFEIIDIKPYTVSSSEIREKISKGENIDNLVPKKVKKIIDVFDLYKEVAHV